MFECTVIMVAAILAADMVDMAADMDTEDAEADLVPVLR